jgi:hypothetical protein
MTYIIVKDIETRIGNSFESYTDALEEVANLFGDDVDTWIENNLRVEENR